MEKDYNKMGKADLLSLDINKMVSDINEQKIVDHDSEPGEVQDNPDGEQEEKEVADGSEDVTLPTKDITNSSDGTAVTEQEDSGLWKSFMGNLKTTGTFAKKEERLSYWIDDDIANTLKSVDIDKMSTSDIINAVLRTFITQEKESLRKFVKKREVLI